MQNIQWYIFWIRSCQINLHPRKIHCFSREVLSLFWMKGRVTKNHWSNEGWCISSFSSVQLLSSVQLFATPWTACSTPGLPVHHQVLEFTQTHVHQVGDAIQPSHPLSSPSPFSLSQHQGLFQSVSSLHQVAKVLEFQLQHQSFQWTPRTDFL